MENNETNRTPILTIMHILFWIVFIGLCIKAGVILISFSFSIFLGAVVIEKMPEALSLSEFNKLGFFHYLNIGLALIVVSSLKAYIAFLGVKISMKINLKQPFNKTICRWIEKVSHIALIIGIVQVCATSYYNDLLSDGIASAKLSGYFGDGGEFLFLAGIIFIIAQVFKRGLEIQAENDLTI